MLKIGWDLIKSEDESVTCLFHWNSVHFYERSEAYQNNNKMKLFSSKSFVIQSRVAFKVTSYLLQWKYKGPVKKNKHSIKKIIQVYSLGKQKMASPNLTVVSLCA